MDYQGLVDEYLADGGTVTSVPMATKKRTGPKPCAKIAQRRERVLALTKQGLSWLEIADRMGLARHTIISDLRQFGMKPNALPKSARKRERADDKRKRRADKSLERISERRRFKRNVAADGTYSKLAPSSADGTLFPDRVFDASDRRRALTDGTQNSKIGGRVLVGPLKGAHVFTLSFEERATCPRSCKHWEGCMGNGMPLAKRMTYTLETMTQIKEDVAKACAQRDLVLVRLHVLGDFPEPDYVRFWDYLLRKHDNLHVFGFTAWGRETPVGAAVSETRDRHGLRFSIRHSETTGPWGSFTVDYPTENRFIGDALVCPEQRDANEGGKKGVHCGSCGACWQSDRPIAFILH